MSWYIVDVSSGTTICIAKAFLLIMLKPAIKYHRIHNSYRAQTIHLVYEKASSSFASVLSQQVTEN